MELQQRRFNTMERRPRMLKDFLSENPNSNSNSNSCSSSGFKSLPRTIKPITNSIQIHHIHSSSSSSSSSSSKFQALIKTIKNNVTFFKITKQPSTILSLPRTLSRKLSLKRRRTSQRCKGEREIEIKTSTVKIKDIIRWKSFRDIQQPLTIPSPPLSPFDYRRFVMESSTVTTAMTCCGSSSDGDSSWSDGDFFSELWDAENDDVEESGKKLFSSFFVGKDSVASFVGDKDDLTCQDEQHSPVSVLRVAENEFSIFDQSLANIERRKQKFRQTSDKFESHAKFDLVTLDECLSLDENLYYGEEHKDDDKEEEDQKTEEEVWIEESAKQLLHIVKATSSSVQNCDDNFDTVLLEFFKEELSGNRNQKRNDEGFELEIMKIAEDWINESFEKTYDIVHVNKDAYIKEMDRRDGWSRFDEELDEMVMEIEAAILHSLIDDIFHP